MPVVRTEEALGAFRVSYAGKGSIVGAGVRNIMIPPIMDSFSGCAPIIFSVFNYNKYNTRCSDPTESGTNASGVFCPHCKTGIILPADSLQSQSMWRLDIRLLPMRIRDINLTSLHF